jgi:hypothetical protein
MILHLISLRLRSTAWSASLISQHRSVAENKNKDRSFSLGRIHHRSQVGHTTGEFPRLVPLPPDRLGTVSRRLHLRRQVEPTGPARGTGTETDYVERSEGVSV